MALGFRCVAEGLECQVYGSNLSVSRHGFGVGECHKVLYCWLRVCNGCEAKDASEILGGVQHCNV